MELEKFEEYGTHFCNLGEESADLFDFKGIEELSDNSVVGEAIYMLSQYLVGNHSQPAAAIRKMNSRDKDITMRTWLDVIHDAEELRKVARFFSNVN